jgi:DUF1680 family protein
MTHTQSDYQIHPVEFTKVQISDSFWSPRIHTAINVTIPYDFKKCEETGRIDNSSKAGGLMEGAHEGIFFDDSDVFKVVEGAAYALQIAPDPELEAYVDDLIDKFVAAQEDDGYLYTARTIDPANVPDPKNSGAERWANLEVGHELYNVGHMYEAAVAYYQATGKRPLLDVAIKNADLIDAVFGEDKKRDVPGHQEIETGLVRLYRVTGDEKYLKLAKFFLDERGQANGRDIYGPYCQDHLPVTQQAEAVGHAVRAAYMYAGMADVATLTGDEDYVSAINTIWDNVVSKKLALTGGIGARHDGEAFGDDYELPNLTAYNETCAAQANILWNHRLFLLTGDAKYIDIFERTLYNGFLAGVGMDGESFFYVNPLSCDGQYQFNRFSHLTRQPWYDCSCCPTNVVRLLPSLSGYIYAVQGDTFYVNLYMTNSAAIDVNKTAVKISQETSYPWNGNIKLKIETSSQSKFALRLRVPGWALNQPVPSQLYSYIDEPDEDGITIKINGEPVEHVIANGFVVIDQAWDEVTDIEIDFPMKIRRVIADKRANDLTNKVALERGPIVYALEEIDNAIDVFDIALNDETQLAAEHHPTLLNGIEVITGMLDTGDKVTAIPYYAWGHRDEGKMTVWMNHK